MYLKGDSQRSPMGFMTWLASLEDDDFVAARLLTEMGCGSGSGSGTAMVSSPSRGSGHHSNNNSQRMAFSSSENDFTTMTNTSRNSSIHEKSVTRNKGLPPLRSKTVNKKAAPTSKSTKVNSHTYEEIEERDDYEDWGGINGEGDNGETALPKRRRRAKSVIEVSYC